MRHHFLNLVCCALAVWICAGWAQATPAERLRELDRQYRDGEISKADYERLWQETLSAGMRDTRVPKLTAAAPAQPEQPRREVFIGASTHFMEILGQDETLAGVTLSAGYRLKPYLRLSLGTRLEAGELGQENLHAIGGFASADYIFLHRSTLSPYLGIGGGWATVKHGDTRETDGFVQAQAGLQLRLSREWSVRLEAAYLDFEDLDARGTGLSLGLSARF